jgi:hypothetical protein
MAQAVPISIERALSTCHLGSSDLEVCLQAEAGHGKLSAHAPIQLLPAEPAAEAATYGPDGAYGRRPDAGACCFPARAPSVVENRRERRLNGARLEVDGVGHAVVPCPKSRRRRGHGLGVHVAAVHESVPVLLQGAEVGRASPVSDKALRPVDRSQPTAPHAHRGPAPRGVADTSKLGAMREERPIERDLQSTLLRASGVLQDVRGSSRGDRAGRQVSRNTPATRNSVRGRCFVELFSGHGGVARAARALGFDAKEYEVRHGVHGDLTNPRVRLGLKTSAHMQKLLSCMLAPDPHQRFPVGPPRRART